MLGGDTVIAKDADSKMQLTEPLWSFIYAPEPAGRERERERKTEKWRAESRAIKTALKSSRLTSSLSSRSTGIDRVPHSLTLTHTHVHTHIRPPCSIKTWAAGVKSKTEALSQLYQTGGSKKSHE